MKDIKIAPLLLRNYSKHTRINIYVYLICIFIFIPTTMTAREQRQPRLHNTHNDYTNTTTTTIIIFFKKKKTTSSLSHTRILTHTTRESMDTKTGKTTAAHIGLAPVLSTLCVYVCCCVVCVRESVHHVVQQTTNRKCCCC